MWRHAGHFTVSPACGGLTCCYPTASHCNEVAPVTAVMNVTVMFVPSHDTENNAALRALPGVTPHHAGTRAKPCAIVKAVVAAPVGVAVPDTNPNTPPGINKLLAIR